MSDETRTVDGSAALVDGWSTWRQRAHAGERLPRLRLLFHPDPARVGALATAIPADGRWLVIGRKAPLFDDQPLADSHISRSHLRVRWLGGDRFEVEPAGGRLPISQLTLDAGRRAPAPIGGTTPMAAGQAIAIGDRVLLGLEVAPTPTPDVQRRGPLGLIGETPAMWRLRADIADVADFDRPVMVIGPTGAGKELVARAIHDVSPRAAGPYIAVNCGGLARELIESTLFGHHKGAFTGADAAKPGVFRAAHGGTLFLDEIGELPPSVQPALLRALQEGEVVPIGGHAPVRIDVRVVVATHRDLQQQVEAGQLREDLYHRLAGHVLTVPALADRRFDVPLLLQHFLDLQRAQDRIFEAALPVGFVADLLQRDWRGNVRALRNLAEQLVRLNRRPGPFRAPNASRPPAAAPTPAAPSVDVSPLAEALGVTASTLAKLLPAGVEATTPVVADQLFALMRSVDYNQSRVAKSLDISRTTLVKLMKTLGLPRAAELSLAEINAAIARAGSEAAAAELLRVSPRALRRQATLLRMKQR